MGIYQMKKELSNHLPRASYLSGFGAIFASWFVLIYQLREFPLSGIANYFELRCQ